MKDNENMFETLLEKAADYGKTSLDLAKLKAVDKTTEVISSLLPHCLVLIIISSALLFISLGLAFWLGEILGNIYYGFFVVAVFYGLTGIVIHFFMHKWLKTQISNVLIEQILK